MIAQIFSALPEPRPMATQAESQTHDQRFLRYARTGDAAVLDALIPEVIDACLVQAKRITGNSAMAEDAVQEAFLNLVRTARKYDGSVTFSAWMGRLVCCAALEQRRRAHRYSREREVVASQSEDGSTENADVERVRRALDDMPDHFRLPLMLHYLSGLSEEETAKSLGLPLGTVSSRLQRGRDKLHEKLQTAGQASSAAVALALLAGSPAEGNASEALKHACASKSLHSAKAAVGAKTIAWISGTAVAVAIVSSALLAGNGGRIPTQRQVIAQATDGMVGHWTLDDGVGLVAADSSGKGNSGSLVGNPAWTAGGKIGGAISFDDVGGYVEIRNSSILENIQESDYTVSAWFRPNAVPKSDIKAAFNAKYAIFVKQGYHEGLVYSNSGRFEMAHWLDYNVSASVLSAQSFAPEAFYHVAGVVNRAMGTTVVYVNGKRAGAANWTPMAVAREFETQTWKIGIAKPLTESFMDHNWMTNGTVDDVRLYDRALPAGEIADLADQGRLP